MEERGRESVGVNSGGDRERECWVSGGGERERECWGEWWRREGERVLG